MNKNWIEVQFSEVITSKKGKKPKVLKDEEFSNSVPYLDIKAFEKGEIRRYADIASSNLIDSNSIGIVWDGARSGWVSKGKSGAIGSTIAKLTPRIVDAKYVFRFLQANFKLLNTETKGTGIPHVNPEVLWNLKFPLAPLNEQKRISDKLDTISEKLDKSKKRLDKILEILKDFRRSVLKSALSGTLSKEWREKHTSTFSEEHNSFPSNSLGWKQVIAQEACEKVSSGSTPKDRPFTPTGDIPFLKVYNIQKQKIAFDYKPQFVTSDIHNEKLKRSIVKPNDVLMNIVGPPLGKIALVTDQYPEWNINQAIVLFRPKSYLLPKYLYYVLCEGREIENISLELKGSAGQQNISLTQSRNFLFDIPSIKEQEYIISRIEELFALADNIEEKYNSAKEKIEKLPESILAKAFRGELVKQNSNDEPAEKLLERILAEKENLNKGKKK
jgi:type I restriction enzyme S subunit